MRRLTRVTLPVLLALFVLVPALAPVAARDTDGDGVRDKFDHCPQTPRQVRVDERGCARDGDGDGVRDDLDLCPDTPPDWSVDDIGCPSDSDGDGVADNRDDCPRTPRGAHVNAWGCVKDADADGIYDDLDLCSDTPRGWQVDSDGCPSDADGDGVADDADDCPKTPRGAHVNQWGCAKDTDGDGVYDGLDACAGTPGGTSVDGRGCPQREPLFEEGQSTLILVGINFEPGRARLTPGSRAALERLARTVAAWSEVPLEIGGHTDSVGDEGSNLRLSWERAQSVRDHLVRHGVSPTHLRVRGYGESRPIADNSTPEGRATNRRVELKKLD